MGAEVPWAATENAGRIVEGPGRWCATPGAPSKDLRDESNHAVRQETNRCNTDQNAHRPKPALVHNRCQPRHRNGNRGDRRR